MMRLVVLVLTLLAGAKIWTQEQIYRSATEEALLQAYRGKAIATCDAVANTQKSDGNKRGAKLVQAAGFATPRAAHLRIGNPELSVPIWEVDHAAWAMRYTYPYIVLEASDAAARCSYDVKLDQARITLL